MKLTLLYRYAIVLTITILQLACSKNDDADELGDPNEGQNDIALIDNAVQSYMDKYNVPGLSLAITKDEKLVYVKAYGKGIKESSFDLSVNNLFRIASISKSITGIAIMKLVEEGKLSLNDKVFGTGALLGTTYGTSAYSANLQAITVKHLLEHTAGSWGNASNDPMFTNPSMTADQLITWTIDNRPVTNTPGSVYSYSNFGYCVLGRVIEKITGKSYEQYVKDAILAPVGITSMMIGGNTLNDRKPNEVQYYGTTLGGSNPYAYNVVRMDAHGGWIASPKDLVRLLVHVDGFSSKTDILSNTSITTMTTPPTLTNPSWYALGWSVNPSNNWWHTGSLPGTSATWARTSLGYNWAIITNTRNSAAGELNELDKIVWDAINGGVQWQNIDQF